MSMSSRPVWGAWIEIIPRYRLYDGSGSRPVWGAWIEMPMSSILIIPRSSRPVWGAWIEMFSQNISSESLLVAPRMGRVD